MDVDAIVRELTDAEGLPEEALLAAAEQKTAAAARFVQEIDGYLSSDGQKPSTSPLIFMFHLLGDWRATSAYRSLAQLLRLPPDEIEDILGDAVTTTSHRVMAAVFDGDPQPLYDIILDDRADEFIRSRMCEVLAMLALSSDLARNEAARFLRDCFTNLRPQAPCFVWDGWQNTIAMLGMGELEDLVKKAFDQGFIDPQCTRLTDFEASLQRGIERPGEPRRPNDDEYRLFGNTIEEISWWACFQEDQYDKAHDTDILDDLSLFDPSTPAFNPHKDIGRNDPCPCGSGRKFKKCCLQ